MFFPTASLDPLPASSPGARLAASRQYFTQLAQTLWCLRGQASGLERIEFGKHLGARNWHACSRHCLLADDARGKNDTLPLGAVGVVVVVGLLFSVLVGARVRVQVYQKVSFELIALGGLLRLH